jgi:hypothetical protein
MQRLASERYEIFHKEWNTVGCGGGCKDNACIEYAFIKLNDGPNFRAQPRDAREISTSLDLDSACPRDDGSDMAGGVPLLAIVTAAALCLGGLIMCLRRRGIKIVTSRECL